MHFESSEAVGVREGEDLEQATLSREKGDHPISEEFDLRRAEALPHFFNQPCFEVHEQHAASLHS